MSAAAVLAIIVAAGEAQNPASTALLEAARQSLGPTTSIRLVEATDSTNARVIHLERDLGAKAVVVLTWKETAHLHAVLRLHVSLADRWTTRIIAFASEDTLTERGRTLGFAVASMAPESTDRAASRDRARPSNEPPPSIAPPRQAEQPAPASSAPGSGPPSTLPVAVLPTPSSALSPSDSQPPPPPLPSLPAPRSTPAPSPAEAAPPPAQKPVRSPAYRFGLGIAGTGSLGAGGPARGLGGELAMAWFPAPSFALRGGLGVRWGSVPEVSGSDRMSSLGLGLEWWPVTDPTKGSWAVGFRADVLVMQQRVTGNLTNGTQEIHERVLPGGDFVIQSFVALIPRLQVVGGLGLQGLLGSTDLRVGDDHTVVATIPAISVVADLGLRIRF